MGSLRSMDFRGKVIAIVTLILLVVVDGVAKLLVKAFGSYPYDYEIFVHHEHIDPCDRLIFDPHMGHMHLNDGKCQVRGGKT